MNGPRVSVMLIFLNDERFLAEAIESARAQTNATGSFFLSTRRSPGPIRATPRSGSAIYIIRGT